MQVLVGYASAHGSTRQIAERVGSRLSRAGVAVHVVPVAELEEIGPYDAVVLGSAIHNGAWLPGAKDVVRANSDVLSRKPVWLFSVGMVAALPRRLQGMGAREGNTVVAEIQELIHPRGHRLFSGAVRRDQLSRWGRLLFRLTGCRYGDYRVWPEIEAWAADIATALVEEAGQVPEPTSRTVAAPPPGP
jgi:menaquinone-dependent protoporphyrinogen oxidase